MFKSKFLDKPSLDIATKIFSIGVEAGFTGEVGLANILTSLALVYSNGSLKIEADRQARMEEKLLGAIKDLVAEVESGEEKKEVSEVEEEFPDTIEG